MKLERTGDASPALAAAYVHGAPARVSVELGRAAAQRLRSAGYRAAVRAAEGALLLTVSLESGNTDGALTAVRAALFDAFAHGQQTTTTAASLDPTPVADFTIACGQSPRTSAAAPGHRNTVLAAVGGRAVLASIGGAYDSSSPWPPGESASTSLPTHDEYTARVAAAPAELTVAVRTPARNRVLPAARSAAAHDSLLALLAQSHPGAWEVVSSDASFVPGGGCLAVRLTTRQAVTPLYAARAAKAVARELEWTLAHEVDEEDPRFDVLEAVSAEEAAERAAWEAITARGVDETAAASQFIGFRGPELDEVTWTRLLETVETPEALPVVFAHEPGQGRVWAALASRCPYGAEDSNSAGHTAGALLGASHAPGVNSVSPFASNDALGLLAWQPTRTAGAEDRVARELARGILQVVLSPHVANRVERLPPSALDSPTWTLALTLATGGHPSWLSQRSTPQSRGLFDAESLRQALRQFLGGPLELAVLANQGSDQAERLAARLAHLLSGVYSGGSECASTISVGGREPPAGEYDVESPDSPTAVMLYVVERRFSDAVRQLATALNQQEGWLRRAIAPLGASAHAVGLGTPSTMAALGITLSAESREALSRAIDQTRMLVATLPKAPNSSWSVPAQMPDASPHARLARLFTEAGSRLSPRADISELVADGLTERRLFVVRPLFEPPAVNAPSGGRR